MCRDAADANDDGQLNIADAIYLLSWLFVPGSPRVPLPNDCDDPQIPELGCDGFQPCP